MPDPVARILTDELQPVPHDRHRGRGHVEPMVATAARCQVLPQRPVAEADLQHLLGRQRLARHIRGQVGVQGQVGGVEPLQARRRLVRDAQRAGELRAAEFVPELRVPCIERGPGHGFHQLTAHLALHGSPLYA